MKNSTYYTAIILSLILVLASYDQQSKQIIYNEVLGSNVNLVIFTYLMFVGSFLAIIFGVILLVKKIK
jgi:hypothetical protein